MSRGLSRRFLVTIVLAAWALADVGVAQRLPRLVVPRHYEIAFAVDLAGETFTGTERIDVEIVEPTRTIVLNALDLELRNVRIRQRNVDHPAVVALDSGNEQASLTIDRRLSAGAASIHLEFSGRLNPTLEGLYLSRSATRKYAVTQFESTDARRAFPSFDEPALKATFAVSATIDSGDTAISNGAIVSDTPGPGAGQHTLKFATTARMSTYLVALAVGDFQCLTGGADGIPIRVCATPDKVELGRLALSAAEYTLGYFNRYFDTDYPFGKLDIVAVPDFAAGAMENTGAIFGRELALLADEARTPPTRQRGIAEVISHEVVHHWFGDLVTMRWWDDIWLNEGFATWMESKPIDLWRPEWRMPAADVRTSRFGIGIDALESARAIRTGVEAAADTEQLFDPLSYEKAGAVLQMTESYVGTEAFRRGVNAYIKSYAYGNATADDFWMVMTKATGQPVDRIVRSFVDQPGVPVVQVTARCEGNRTRVELRQQRFLFNPAARDNGSTWNVPVCLRGDGPASCTLLGRREQALTLNGCSNTLFANPSARGYYVTAYDSTLLKANASSADRMLDAAERTVLVDDTWALVGSGRYQIGDFLDIAQAQKERLGSGDWDIQSFRLQYIGDNLVDAATADPFGRWVRQLLQPAFNRLGWDAAADDSVERRAARAAIATALGRLGRDAAVLAEARRRADRYLRGELETDPVMLDTIVTLAAIDGDQSLFERLMASAGSAKLPQDARRALNALSQFRDPALAARMLEYAVSPEARGQDAPLLFGGALRNPATRELGWSFVKTRWSEVRPKTEGPFGSIVFAAETFCDARLRNDVLQFFTEHPLDGSDRPLRGALETMDSCIRMKEQQARNLANWLQKF